MSRLMETRLRKLEGQRKARPELKCFWKLPGETWEQLRERARAWQAEKPETRWPTPQLVGLRDGEERLDLDQPRRFHE